MEYGDKLDGLYRKFNKIKSVMESCLKEQKEDVTEFTPIKEERLEVAYKWGKKILYQYGMVEIDNIKDSIDFCQDYYVPICEEIDNFYEKMKKKLFTVDSLA